MQEKTTALTSSLQDDKPDVSDENDYELDPLKTAPVITNFSHFFSPFNVGKRESFALDPRIFVAIGKGKPPQGMRGPLQTELKYLAGLNERTEDGGYNIFMAVHQIHHNGAKLVGRNGEEYIYSWKGGGAKKVDIAKPLAAFLEIDFKIEDKNELKEAIRNYKEVLGASMIVESSRGKLHVYWRYGDGAKIDWDIHEKLQHVLAWKFGGDFQKISTPEKLMRVPGLIHNKDLTDKPFVSALHHCNKKINYANIEEIVTAAQFTQDDMDQYKKWVDSGGLANVLGKAGGVTDGEAPVIAYDPTTYLYTGAGEGDRDDAMYNFILQVLVKRRGIRDKDELFKLALEADKLNTPPLIETEGEVAGQKVIKDKIRSALSSFKRGQEERGIRPPEEVFPEEGEELEELIQQGVVDASGGSPPLPPASQGYDYSSPDFNNPVDRTSVVARMVGRYGAYMAYYREGGFYTYNGKIWANGEASDTMIATWLLDVTANMHQERIVQQWFTDKDGHFSPKAMKKEISKLKDSETIIKGKLANRPEIKCGPDDFERGTEATLLATKNGILDLITGKLIPPSPDYRLTHELPFNYNEDATNKVWEDYIGSSLDWDQDSIRYLRQICGYLISGCNHIPALIIFQGPQGSGKSTVVNVLMEMMGKYSKKVMKEIILDIKGANETAKLSSLAQASNCRFVTVPETSSDQKWSMEAVKSLTGKDKITAKLYHQDTITFTPRFKIALSCNEIPTPKNIDEAFWIRLLFVLFPKSFRGTADEITDLDEKIRDYVCPKTGECGLSGVLTWCVGGFQDLMQQPQQRFTESKAAKELKSRQRRLHDNVGQFFAELLEDCDYKDGLTKAELSEAYYNWVADNDAETTEGWEKYFSQKGYGLKKVNFTKPDGKKSSKRCWPVRIKAGDGAEAAEESE